MKVFTKHKPLQLGRGLWQDGDVEWFLGKRYSDRLVGAVDPRVAENVRKQFEEDWAVISGGEQYVKRERGYGEAYRVMLKSGAGNTKLAEEVWNTLLKRKWVTLELFREKIRYGQRRGQRRAELTRLHTIHKNIAEQGMQPTASIYETTVWALATSRHLPEATQIYQKMLEIGVQSFKGDISRYLVAVSTGMVEGLRKLDAHGVVVREAILVELIQRHGVKPGVVERAPDQFRGVVEFLHNTDKDYQMKVIRETYSHGGKPIETPFTPPPRLALEIILCHAPHPLCGSTAHSLYPHTPPTPSVLLTYARIFSITGHAGRAAWVYRNAVAEGLLPHVGEKFIKLIEKTLRNGGMEEQAVRVRKGWVAAKKTRKVSRGD